MDEENSDTRKNIFDDRPLLEGMGELKGNPEENIALRHTGTSDLGKSKDEKYEEGDDYDPHLHREIEHPTTNMETLTNLLKGCLGTGILAMPEAFKNAGLVCGIISTLIIGFLCTYCLHILVKTQYVLCKKLKVPMLTYPKSAKLALESGPNCLKFLAPLAPLTVNIFLVIYQMGICCCYVIFVASNLKSVVDYHLDTKIRIELYMLILLVPFIVMNLIRNLKLLAPFSTLANVFTFVSFGIVLYYVVQGLPPLSEVPAVGSLGSYPLFFGTTLFALEAVGVVIASENNMATPKGFGGYFGVLNIAMFNVVFLYMGMGFIGYWRYLDTVESTITLNLPTEDGKTQAVQIFYSLAILISFALQMFVALDILWNTYIKKYVVARNASSLFWEIVLRIATVIITGTLAILIPRLGLFISLFGAFCLSVLGFIFPALMEMCVHWERGPSKIKLLILKDVLLILFGFAGLTIGTTTTLIEIVRSFQEETK